MNTPEIKACPFCGRIAQHHEGDDWVIPHTSECFFTQQYAGEMWLVGKRRIEQWNARAGDRQPATSETGGVKALA